MEKKITRFLKFSKFKEVRGREPALILCSFMLLFFISITNYAQNRVVLNGQFTNATTGIVTGQGGPTVAGPPQLATTPLVDNWFTSAPTGPGPGFTPFPIEVTSGTLGNITGGVNFNASAVDGATGTEVPGNNYIELNAYVASRVYQYVYMINGESIEYQYYHGRRQGNPETVQFALFAENETAAVATPLYIIDTSSLTTQNTWINNKGTYTFTGPTGVYQIGFQATAPAGSLGNTLDGVAITLDPIVELSASTYNIAENSSDTPKLRVNGTVGTAQTVTLQIDGGTATSPGDYSLTTTVNVPAGAYSLADEIDILLTLVNDGIVEPDETVEISILSVSSSLIQADANGDGTNQNSTIVTITNDDTSVSIAATDAVKAEGNAGNTAFTFDVTRTGVTSGASSVNYAVAGSGANPANAADFGGSFPSGTVNFAATETSKTITIDVSGDTGFESSEGFTVTLSSPVGTGIGTATATGTITNDDNASSNCNLIVNGDFSNGATSWADSFPTSPATGPISFTSGPTGRMVSNVDNDGNLHAGNVILKNTTAFNLNAGTNYTFSIDQFNTLVGTNINFAWVLLDNSNAIVQTIASFHTRAGGTGTTQITTVDTNYDASFTVGATASYQLALVWEGQEDGAGDDVTFDNIVLQATGASPPTITLSSSALNTTYGDTSVNLAYTGVTNSPNQYSIDFDTTAEGQGFSDVTATSLPASPIAITVPSTANAATYNATLRVINSVTGCVSNGTAITITVAQKALTVSVTANNKIYDATTTAAVTLGSPSLVGIESGDVVTIATSPTAWDFASIDVNTGISVTATTGTYTITGADAGNYTVTQPTGLTANITPKALTVNVTANNKIHDGNTTATVTLGSPALAGVEVGDVVTIATSPTVWDFASSNVGTSISVTATTGSYTIGGTNAGNYTVTQPSGLTADITPGPVSNGANGTEISAADGAAIA
ncbi:beta strand repeat-containing protein, partial [Tenacibaculum amylolyticum]|uniref:beta strand repeat-containing protein n=1 Tax=Tenacibaculum amylolyticum TaxID=104269 RepID=UPI0038B512A0